MLLQRYGLWCSEKVGDALHCHVYFGACVMGRGIWQIHHGSFTNACDTKTCFSSVLIVVGNCCVSKMRLQWPKYAMATDSSVATL